MTMTQWFLKDDVWHAFELSDPGALCGEVRITYGVDPIADFVPAGGTAHTACEEAVAVATPPPFQPEPAPAPEPDAEPDATIDVNVEAEVDHEVSVTVEDEKPKAKTKARVRK